MTHGTRSCLFGLKDFLDQISQSQPGLTSASDSAYSSSSHSADIDLSQIISGATSHLESSSRLGDHFSTFSPFPMGRPYERSASSDGRLLDPRSSLTTGSKKQFGIDPLDGLIRSQSAAPSLHGGRASLGPPPGMQAMSSAADSFASRGLQRPASTGGAARSALRPSAKTLMDLIQEDFPNESYSQDQDDVPERAMSGRASQSPTQLVQSYPNSYAPTPVTSNQYPPAQQSASVLYEHPQSQRQQQQLHQNQVLVEDPYQSQTMQQVPRYSSGDFALETPLQQSMAPVYQTEPRQHQIYVQSQMNHSQQPQQGMVFVHGGGGGTRPQQPPSQSYSVHMSESRPQQQDQVQQVITTASGQMVYISAPVSPEQSNFAYSTAMAYPAGHGQPQQQAQIIQNIVGNNDQYVSVVPLHNGGYWQADHAKMSNNMPTVTIVHGQPMTLQRLGSVGAAREHSAGSPAPTGQNHYQSRHSSRESKHVGNRPGGRGGRHSRRSDAKGHSSGSPLLNEFRATKNRDWSMHQIAGHVVEFCQDQNGSRFIQQRLEMRNLDEQQVVVTEVLPAIRRLRNDVFGNYVVQKLLDFGTPDVKAAIRDTLRGEMVQLSFQMYGCRVVQKALEGLLDEDLPDLLSEFQHNVLSCIHDQNGNHVIQKCIEVVCMRLKHSHPDSPIVDEHIDFIIRDVLVNAPALSCHPYGCRVLQRILEHCNEDRKYLILDEVMKSHRKLLDDQYGNYVIQHVLQFGRDVDRDSILEIILESGLLGLSRQKFASNVVEKLLKYGNSNHCRAIVREMLKVNP